MMMPDDLPRIPEMQKAISRLRLLLASVKSKQDELDAQARQFRRQLTRAPRHAIHGANPLEATLNIMGEIQERLDHVEQSRAHLANIKKQAEDELQALNITGLIEESKSELANLKKRRDTGEDTDPERIQELERFIEEASIRAAQAITDDFDVPEL